MNPLDFIFPKRCVGCNKIGSYFCSSCVQNIKQTELVCPFCERASIGGVVHAVCKRRYGLDGLWSLGIYQDPLRKAIQKLKYRWITELAKILVDITIEYWARFNPFILDQIKKDHGQNWIVVPVPLHWTRQNWRGFNQSGLFAKDFAQKLDLQYLDALKRIKKTKSQIQLKSEDRRQNIKGAFTLTHNALLKNQHVILVDDVWTTGSTLKECCFVLKRGGAKKVWALTLAR